MQVILRPSRPRLGRNSQWSRLTQLFCRLAPCTATLHQYQRHIGSTKMPSGLTLFRAGDQLLPKSPRPGWALKATSRVVSTRSQDHCRSLWPQLHEFTCCLPTALLKDMLPWQRARACSTLCQPRCQESLLGTQGCDHYTHHEFFESIFGLLSAPRWGRLHANGCTAATYWCGFISGQGTNLQAQVP